VKTERDKIDMRAIGKMVRAPSKSRQRDVSLSVNGAAREKR
jgi:hypothetical protein